MPRILIAGCGYVGQAAADLLHERGWTVQGWTASPESASQLEAKPYSVRAVDIASSAAVLAAREEFDVVVHCASSGGGEVEDYRRVYLDGARNLRDAFPEASLLLTSSTSVYAQKDGEIVEEASPAEPAHERGRILREAEKTVLSQNGGVLRLGGIYGPGRSFFLRKFLSGEALSGEGSDRFINQVHRDDITSALLFLAEQRAQGGRQIYNVVDDQPIRASEAYQWLTARLKRPLPTGAGKVASKRKRGEDKKGGCQKEGPASG